LPNQHFRSTRSKEKHVQIYQLERKACTDLRWVSNMLQLRCTPQQGQKKMYTPAGTIKKGVNLACNVYLEQTKLSTTRTAEAIYTSRRADPCVRDPAPVPARASSRPPRIRSDEQTAGGRPSSRIRSWPGRAGAAPLDLLSLSHYGLLALSHSPSRGRNKPRPRRAR
jgi:hypothetical protein